MAMRRAAIARRLGAVILVAIVVASALPVGHIGGAPLALLPRGPIYISWHANFTAENGVTAGRGTATDPYIIEGWEIDAHGTSGVYVGSYDYAGVSVVVRDLLIRNTTRPAPPGSYNPTNCCTYGIGKLPNNALVSNVTVLDSYGGVNLDDNSGTTIVDSTFRNISGYSVSLLRAKNATLSRNTLDAPVGPTVLSANDQSRSSTIHVTPDNTVGGAPYMFIAGANGTRVADQVVGQLDIVDSINVTISNVSGGTRPLYVRVDSSELVTVEKSSVFALGSRQSVGVTFTDNDVLGASSPLSVWSGENITIAGNRVSGVANGVQVNDVSGGTIEGNLVANCTAAGVSVTSSQEIAVLNNSVDLCNTGARLYGSYNLTFAGNSLTHGGTGLQVTNAYNVSLTGNRISDNNGTGIRLEEAYLVDVSDNDIARHPDGGISLGGGLFNLTVAGNRLTDDGLVVDSWWPGMTDYMVIGDDNLVNGAPLRFYHDCAGERLDGQATGQLIVFNCTGFVASNLSIAGPEQPVTFAFVADSALEGSTVVGGSRAIYGYAAQGLRLEGNTVRDGDQCLYLEGVEGLQLLSNRVAHCGWGVMMASVDGGRVALNVIDSDSSVGLYVDGSSHLTFFGNHLPATGLLLGAGAIDTLATHEIDESNLAAGQPIRYFKNCTGSSLSAAGAGQVIIANCTGSSLRDLSLAPGGAGISAYRVRDFTFERLNVSGTNGTGLSVWGSSNVTIRDVEASALNARWRYMGYEYDVGTGVYVGKSSGVAIERLRAARDATWGLYIGLSDNVTVANSTFDGTNGSALAISSSPDCTVAGSRFSGNKLAIAAAGDTPGLNLAQNVFEGNPQAISLRDLDRPVVAYNDFNGSTDFAIFLDRGKSPYIRGNAIRDSGEALNLSRVEGGRVEENNLTHNAVGATLQYSRNIIVLRNFFIGNTVQAYDNTAVNFWNGTADEGGNYWSDYAGHDHCSGPGQDQCTAGDGFGDTPRQVLVGPGGFSVPFPPYNAPPPGLRNGTDRFPLMEPVLPLPSQPPCADSQGRQPAPAGPNEVVRAVLIALFALVAISAAWVSLARVRPRAPPPEKPGGPGP